MNRSDDFATDRKTRSHERIVDAAARAIRLHGIAGVGVAEVMREAGLTHGGFYAHFPSRDALLVAALERAGRASGDAIRRRVDASIARAASDDASRESHAGSSPFSMLVSTYLRDSLLAAQDGGCPVASLCSEMSRSTGDVRAASVERVRALVRYVARNLPAGVPEDEAGAIAGTLVGTLQLARTLGDTPEGRALLASTRESLIARIASNRIPD